MSNKRKLCFDIFRNSGHTTFKQIKLLFGRKPMNIKSVSLAYIFLGISIISLLISLYLKIIVIKTSPGRKDRNRIIGDIKDPITWREGYNTRSYIFIFWSTISLLIFIYLKFFDTEIIISTVYLFVYICILIISVLLSIIRVKATS